MWPTNRSLDQCWMSLVLLLSLVVSHISISFRETYLLRRKKWCVWKGREKKRSTRHNEYFFTKVSCLVLRTNTRTKPSFFHRNLPLTDWHGRVTGSPTTVSRVLPLSFLQFRLPPPKTSIPSTESTDSRAWSGSCHEKGGGGLLTL